MRLKVSRPRACRQRDIRSAFATFSSEGHFCAPLANDDLGSGSPHLPAAVSPWRLRFSTQPRNILFFCLVGRGRSGGVHAQRGTAPGGRHEGARGGVVEIKNRISK